MLAYRVLSLLPIQTYVLLDNSDAPLLMLSVYNFPFNLEMALWIRWSIKVKQPLICVSPAILKLSEAVQGNCVLAASDFYILKANIFKSAVKRNMKIMILDRFFLASDIS